MAKYRIIWSSRATGTDETWFIGSIEDARTSALAMVGQPVYFQDEQIDVVDSAFVADGEGNEV